MKPRLEVSASVIIHATESADTIQDAMCMVLQISKDSITTTRTTGHFENEIIILDAKIMGNDARKVVEVLRGSLSGVQACALAEQIEERTVDSRLHIRLDKQALVRDGRACILGLDDDNNYDMPSEQKSVRDIIKVKIHTPIYDKKETKRIFEDVLGIG